LTIHLISIPKGKIPGALNYTPCGGYLVYPLGAFVVLKNISTGKEAFLDGHNNDVSCIGMSHNGEKLASGILHLTGVKVNFDEYLFVTHSPLCHH
jgi:hypothetical protein